MTDPAPTKIKLKPRRAPPLQPDRPGPGRSAEPAADSDAAALDAKKGTPADPESVKRQKEQADTALGNVRKGYD